MALWGWCEDDWWLRTVYCVSPQSLAAQADRPCLTSLPTEGIPGSAQQVIQVDRDTVLVSFERECLGSGLGGSSRPEHGKHGATSFAFPLSPIPSTLVNH